MIIAIMLSVAGLGFLCWLAFNLAVYAAPFYAGVAAGLFAYHTGAGPIGGAAIAMAAGATTLVAGQFAFAHSRSTILRTMIAAAFALPAAVAGYHLVLGVSTMGMPSDTWRHVFAIIGAAVVGSTAGRALLPRRQSNQPGMLASRPCRRAETALKTSRDCWSRRRDTAMRRGRVTRRGGTLGRAFRADPDFSLPYTGRRAHRHADHRGELRAPAQRASPARPRRPSSGSSIAKSPLHPPYSIAAHTASDGLIWPEDGFASIALPQRQSPTSFPCRLRRHSSRTKQVGASPSSAALRLETECGVDRSRPVDRHRGCDGRGLETAIRGESSWRTSARSRRSMPSFRARS
jgi:hypothetical protein